MDSAPKLKFIIPPITSSAMADHTKIIDKFLKLLYPINRSITGNGNRETLRYLQEVIPVEIKEYPSGEKVYDWIIPKEWNIRDAWIKNSRGEKIIDFQKNNLHLVSYSTPIHKRLKLEDLNNRLHYLKGIPEAIPYRTSYYKEDWGFCLSYNDYIEYFKKDEEYEVFVDSTLEDGYLTIGEFLIKGKSKQEHLISTYICHPSMANDNLSGIILTALLAKELLKKKLNFSYRFLFVPETIGAIAYCAKNEKLMKNIDCGFVITTVGGPGKFGFKQSYDKNHILNSIIIDVFKENEIDYVMYPFDINGSDERQYSSVGFRMNIATITKDKYYEYDYYHTSFDDLNYVKSTYINEALNLYLRVIDILDSNIRYKNKYPNCEVWLSKHGLYPTTGGGLIYKNGIRELTEQEIILWLMFYCDGKVGLYEISKKIGISIYELKRIAKIIEDKGLLEILA